MLSRYFIRHAIMEVVSGGCQCIFFTAKMRIFRSKERKSKFARLGLRIFTFVAPYIYGENSIKHTMLRYKYARSVYSRIITSISDLDIRLSEKLFAEACSMTPRKAVFWAGLYVVTKMSRKESQSIRVFRRFLSVCAESEVEKFLQDIVKISRKKNLNTDGWMDFEIAVSSNLRKNEANIREILKMGASAMTKYAMTGVSQDSAIRRIKKFKENCSEIANELEMKELNISIQEIEYYFQIQERILLGDNEAVHVLWKHLTLSAIESSKFKQEAVWKISKECILPIEFSTEFIENEIKQAVVSKTLKTIVLCQRTPGNTINKIGFTGSDLEVLSLRRASGQRSVTDILVNHGSAEDLKAVSDANLAAEWLLRSGFVQTSIDGEATQLAFADRLFGLMKRYRSIQKFLFEKQIEQVVIAIDGENWFEQLAIGVRLCRDGWPVFVDWRSGKGGVSTSVRPGLSNLFLDDHMGDDEHQNLSADPNAEITEENMYNKNVIIGDVLRSDVFLVCAISDINYRSAFFEAVSAISDKIPLAVFETTGSDVDILQINKKNIQYFTARDISGDAKCRRIIKIQNKDSVTSDVAVRPEIVSAIFGLSAIINRINSSMAINALAVDELLKRTGAKIAITLPGRMPEARIATELARRMGCKTIDIQAFFMSSHPRYLASKSDIFLSITKDQADLYKKNLNPPVDQHVETLGALAFDWRCRQVSGLTRSDARRSIGVAEEAEIVLFAAQHGVGSEGESILRGLLEKSKSWPGTRILIVKLHPREPEDKYISLKHEIASEYKNVIVSYKESVYPMIIGSDVVVTQFSNVGLEAAILQRRVIAVRLGKTEYPVDLAELGIAELATSMDELGALVDNAASPLREVAKSRVDGYFAENPRLISMSSGRALCDIVEGVLNRI